MHTFKNKMMAILMVILSFIPVTIDSDITALVFVLMLAIPMFFAKENWFVE